MSELIERIESLTPFNDEDRKVIDDAAARIRELEAIVEAAKALVEVRRRFVSVAWYMPEHPGNQYWIDKFMAAYTPLEQAIRAAEAAKGKA